MGRGFGSGGFKGGGSSRGSGGSRGHSVTRAGTGARPSSATRGRGPQSGSSYKGRAAKAGPKGVSTGKPKGQIRDGKAVQYSIKDSKGRTKYIGTTNNPSRRATEHRESGKLGRGDKLVVETKPVARTSAENVEKGKLYSHRQQHGRNPKHNRTNDGKFHQGRLF